MVLLPHPSNQREREGEGVVCFVIVLAFVIFVFAILFVIFVFVSVMCFRDVHVFCLRDFVLLVCRVQVLMRFAVPDAHAPPMGWVCLGWM